MVKLLNVFSVQIKSQKSTKELTVLLLARDLGEEKDKIGNLIH